ncbi:HAD superfamily hydrolase [Arthroderma uncinatum]|uniref:HAD superfamily hydrolase n=1 Tax=Arthroderma uncinatum TaxID=74035 RepID=UPI00144A9B2B|nr:HAD superfamily hydrolase [Arthroderma uncinatum]KAF3490871.1 HAD superfamily hydrolase [Arthroderma uncinatum]
MAVNHSSNRSLPPVRACLFDMDGLLIDSEDIYTLVINQILHEYGKPSLPWSIKAQLQGRPQPQSGQVFQQWAQLPIPQAELQKKIAALQKPQFPKTKPLPGVVELISTLSRAALNFPPVHIALATSSTTTNFNLKTSHLSSLFSQFSPSRTIVGDDPRIAPGRGKPLPDIYLLALDTINKEIQAKGEPPITPAECLVFEDSVPGVEAGRRAGMRVIWCPYDGLLEVYKDQVPEVLAGLTGAHKDADHDGLDTPAVLNSGKPGSLNDGWGELVRTLESFPYAKYGIKVV